MYMYHDFKYQCRSRIMSHRIRSDVTTSMHQDKNVKSSRSKEARSVFSRSSSPSSSFKRTVCASGISCWVSLLNAQNPQTRSFITGRLPSLQAVHSAFSSQSFRFFVSGCPDSAGSFIGTSGRTGVSPLLVSSVSLSAASVSAPSASNEKNRLE
jgi:hypothetical protein